MVSANDRCALTFSLSPGNAHDGVEGRKLLSDWQDAPQNIPLVMDRAYEGDETRQLALDLGFEPVVPPKSNRRYPWQYNKQIYKRRNEIERLFRRLKGFRRIFSRFEKLDIMFKAFINFVLIIDIISVNTP
jgi:transposase